jgi:hypothetical protein
MKIILERPYLEGLELGSSNLLHCGDRAEIGRQKDFEQLIVKCGLLPTSSQQNLYLIT